MNSTRLFAPASYVDATDEVRRRVVNGCGPRGWKSFLIPDTIWGLSILAACNVHDWMYAAGETIEQKDEADRVFFNNMLRLIEAAGGPHWLQWLRRQRAYKYYLAVVNFGGPAYWVDKNRPETLLPVVTALA